MQAKYLHEHVLLRLQKYSTAICSPIFSLQLQMYGAEAQRTDELCVFDDWLVVVYIFWVRPPLQQTACPVAQVCTVFAQLTINGKWEGPHVFVVRIRDDQGQLSRGVRIRDNGRRTVSSRPSSPQLVLDLLPAG